MALHIRAARKDDLDRLLAIHFAAYPDGRSVEERRRNFGANALGTMDDLVVVEREGSVVGHAFLFPLEAWFGGRAVRLGGIASVAIAPEARSQGVGTALMGALHRASDVRGDALTMLYAFRQRFYARLGYGASLSRRRLELDPASIPRAWSTLAKARVRGVGRNEGEAVRASYEEVARDRTGWLTRPPALWDRHFARERRHFLVVDGPEKGTLAGFVAFEIAQAEPHAETRLFVDELVARDDETRLALLGALGAMRGQVDAIEIELAADDPLEIALLDPDGRRNGEEAVEHALGAVVGGPMVRIEDIPRSIEARGYPGGAHAESFDVVVQSSDPTKGAADEIAISVQVEGHRARVASARAAASAVRTTRAGLAAVLYGGVPLGAAVRLGLADADPRTVARVEPVLALPPPAPIDSF